MSAPKKANKPQASAARNKSPQAGKRSGQGAKAAQTTPPEAPAGQKSKSTNVVKQGEKKGGHNHVIVEDIDDKHVSVGLTTKSKKGKNHPNLPLEQSPLGDGKESFVRRQGTVAPKKEYKAPRKGKMTQNDYTKVKKIGEKAKKKYLEEKATKK